MFLQVSKARDERYYYYFLILSAALQFEKSGVQRTFAKQKSFRLLLGFHANQ